MQSKVLKENILTPTVSETKPWYSKCLDTMRVVAYKSLTKACYTVFYVNQDVDSIIKTYWSVKHI